MFPVLISIGPLTVHTYGFLIAVGFLLAVWLMRRLAARHGVDTHKIADLALISMLGGLVGGRLLYIITQWDHYSANPQEIFMVWKGGLVFYGGLLGGLLTYMLVARRMKLPVLRALDIAAPGVAFAHIFGRLGCWAAGCCFGRELEKDSPLARIFHGVHRHPTSLGSEIALHPTQLYDAFNCLVILAVLLFVDRRKKFDGQIAAVYFMLYAVGRSLVESYRGDAIRGFVIDGWLSTSQFISVFIFAAGLAIFAFNRRRVLA